MKITFGKFKNWDTNDVAKAGEYGRNYLSWGASNLKSPMWADEFAKALGNNTEQDDNLAAKALYELEGESWDEALRYVHDQRIVEEEMQQEFDEFQKNIGEFKAKWAAKFGVDVVKMHKIAVKIFDADYYGMLRPSDFSSDKMYQLAKEMLADAEKTQCYFN